MATTADRILFVCTANRCRSPFAEALTRERVGELPIEVDSAGIDAADGLPVPGDGLRVAAERGLDLAGHRSRRVDPRDLEQYDLILALARVHARELLAAAPGIGPRLFTLRQFTRWIDTHPRPVRSLLGSWLDAAAADRSPTLFLGSDAADDIADPIGQSVAHWRRMADDLDAQADTLIGGLRPRRG